jgi:hypothetical protein
MSKAYLQVVDKKVFSAARNSLTPKLHGVIFNFKDLERLSRWKAQGTALQLVSKPNWL